MGLQLVLWDEAMKTNGADPNTQLKRLGGSSFSKLTTNAPKGCPISNNQQDGHMQTDARKGHVNYEPNS